jgi:hypothetical protein
MDGKNRVGGAFGESIASENLDDVCRSIGLQV